MSVAAVLIRFPGDLDIGYESLKEICNDDHLYSLGTTVHAAGYVFGAADYIVWLHAPAWANVAASVEYINKKLNNIIPDHVHARCVSTTLLGASFPPEHDLLHMMDGVASRLAKSHSTPGNAIIDSNVLRPVLAAESYLSAVLPVLSRTLNRCDQKHLHADIKKELANLAGLIMSWRLDSSSRGTDTGVKE